MALSRFGSNPRMKVMWHLSWPAIIEQVLATMVSYVDTAMVGVLGAAATASVSVNASSIWLINGILAGIGVGYSVQVSNAIGAEDDARARRIIRQGILATVYVVWPPCFSSSCWPPSFRSGWARSPLSVPPPPPICAGTPSVCPSPRPVPFSRPSCAAWATPRPR